jgi:hypothetical protein
MVATMSSSEARQTERPRHRLFSSQNVGVATFLGSVLGGSILLAINYRRLGRGRLVIPSILLGVVATSMLIAVAFLAPDGLPRPVYTGVVIAIAFAMAVVTDKLQGEALAAHERAGGRVGAGWATAGIGLAGLVVAGAGVLGGVHVADSIRFGDGVELGKMTVYYKDGATEVEARRTAEYLRDQGMTEHEIDVQLRRRSGTMHVVFIVEKGSASEDEFRLIGRDLSLHCFGGAPVVMDLADDTFEVHTSIPVDSK